MAVIKEPNNAVKNNSQEPVRSAWWQPAMMMFLRLSAWIAGPVIIALFLGKWLDKKFNSGPWLFLFCTIIAFIISMFGLVKHTLTEYKKIENTGAVETKQTEQNKKINKKQG